MFFFTSNNIYPNYTYCVNESIEFMPSYYSSTDGRSEVSKQ